MNDQFLKPQKMTKTKVLFCGEATYLNTGYSTYGRELLSRLYKHPQLEVAEFGSYGSDNDPRVQNIPWKFYGGLPQNETEQQYYNSDPVLQFGAWKFDRICLDFKPDIVTDIRDTWMCGHELISPLRRHYKLIWMPTVDSNQDERWIADFMGCDGITTYSDWGLDQLKQQGGDKLKLYYSTPPCANFQHFYIVPNKKLHKKNFGIPEDSFIIGTVMRNQRRKLYPDLFYSFSKFLEQAPKEISDKSYLYLHTAYPDAGWDIPKLLKEYGIAHKTILTYFCKKCGNFYPSRYQDVRVFCKKCHYDFVTFSNTQAGIGQDSLGQIYNCFDAYVQYSNCEGFGIPLVEAASCGIPVFATDYSAMSDVVRKLKGYPIDVVGFYRETETHRKFAVPDNNDLVKKLIQYSQLSESSKRQKSFETRMMVEKNYNWENTAKKWIDILTNIPKSNTWNDPPRFCKPITTIPENMTQEEFINWGLINLAGRPDLVNSYLAIRLTRDLIWGCSYGLNPILAYTDMAFDGNDKYRPFNKEHVINFFNQLVNSNNHWEQIRTGISFNG